MPPTRKYESEGGPGIRAILDLLKGSDTPEADRRRFLKAQIVFWLLGATDGHAKNFSLRLAPGGRFTMAPLYDVLSTQPLLDAGQITKRQMKLSMAVGKNRHYGVDAVVPRHFMQTADTCDFPEKTILAIFAELVADGAKATERVLAEMPRGFPQKLARSILGGFRRRLALLAETA